MNGICMCTSGPPAGGRCMACGAYGEPIPSPYVPQPVVDRPIVMPATEIHHHHHTGLTADEVREIVREELEKAARANAS